MIYFDEPKDTTVTSPFVPLQGWFAVDREPTSVSITLDGHPLREPSFYSRADVEAVYPRKVVRGFSAVLDMAGDARRASKTTVKVEIDDDEVKALTLDVSDAVLGAANRVAMARERKRAWVLAHLRCPVCFHSQFDFPEGALRCTGCGARYEQRTRALNLIPPAEADRYAVSTLGNISTHGYDESVRVILDKVRGQGGTVLDCGAGLRQDTDELIINMEITDFPSTDVISANQNLPFQDNVFDAVLSLHVLEHVNDPFQSAKELARVLKPGGTLLCIIPLIAPEHGFPYHFFNMTRSGLLELFKGRLIVEQLFMPASGHPINSLQWILNVYQQYLPPATQQRFREMSVGDILSRPLAEWLGNPIATDLAEHARWTLASNISAVLTKPL